MTYPTPDAAGSETPDFTVNRDPHCFTIAPDQFCAPAIISSVALRKLASLAAANAALPPESEDAAERSVDLICDMFRLLLPGGGGRTFAERVRSDGDPGDPEAGIPASPPVIDIAREATPALNWLMERYGLRPMQPSSPSLDGSTDGQTNTPSDTTSSMDGASPEASASEN